MKNQFYILVCILFISCDFLGLQKKDIPVRKPIASVHNNNLYTEDIKLLIPKNIEKNDSLVFTRSIINSWAVKQLLLKKAEDNNTQNDN